MDKGFLEEFGLVEEVVARWPGAVALRVAVPTEERDDGTTKVRTIIL